MRGERREKRLETLCREAEIGSDHAEKAEGSDGANPLIPTVLIQTIERGALLVELQSEAVAVLVFFLCVRKEGKKEATSLVMARMSSRRMLFVRLSRVDLSYIENDC